MTKKARQAAGVAVVGMFLWACPARAAIEDAHVRSASVAINAAIEHAIERSATFRQMVQTIQESDSIVFLTEGDCPLKCRPDGFGKHGAQAALFHLIDRFG